jgi:hypothetical protein
MLVLVKNMARASAIFSNTDRFSKVLDLFVHKTMHLFLLFKTRDAMQLIYDILFQSCWWCGVRSVCVCGGGGGGGGGGVGVH